MINWHGIESRIAQIKKGYSSGGRKSIKIIFIIVWIVFLASILWAGWQNRLIIQPYLAQANFFYLLGATASYLLSLTAVIIGWVLIMNALNISLPFWRHAQVYCLTLAARRLPGTIWYIGGRVLVYQRLIDSKSIVLIASSIEFIIILIAGSLVSFAFLLTAQTTLPSIALFAAVVVIAIGILVFHPSVLRYISKISGKGEIKSISMTSVAGWLVAYSIMWIMGGVMLIQLVSIFQPIEAKDYLFLVGSWALSGVAGTFTFFLPSSFGVSEISLAALLTLIMPFPLAGVIAISARLITLTFEVLLSLILIPFSLDLIRRNSSSVQE